MRDDPLQTFFQFVLMIGGIVYFFLRITSEDYAMYVKWPLLVVGGLYVLYKGSNMENQLSKKFFFMGAFISLILWLGFNHLLEAGECTLKRACPEGMFCSADHICHQFPEYTNKITLYLTNLTIDLTLAGLIIGLSLIISAIILRKTSFYSRISNLFSRAFNKIKRIVKKS
jgi:hypothetical protein